MTRFLGRLAANVAMWFDCRMAENPYIYTILGDDVRSQLKASRAILAEAEKLQSVLGKIDDPSARMVVQESIQRLLTVANGMTANAATTTSTVSGTIGTIVSGSWKK